MDLLRFAPTLSVARAMLGPLVQVRGMTARITYPDQPNQETHWHQHLRVVAAAGVVFAAARDGCADLPRRFE